MDTIGTIFKIANLYYREAYTQQKIADTLEISRPTVSRLLSKAHKMGMVRIELVPPAGFSDLEISLARRLGLKQVLVAPRNNQEIDNYTSRVANIAEFAGQRLSDMIHSDMAVGIGWGVTLYQTVLSLTASQEAVDTVFVPLVGSAGRNESHYQVNVIVDRIARNFAGKAMFFNIPAFIKSSQIIEELLSDPQLKSIQGVWGNLDLAIIGLGAFEGIPNFLLDEYTPEAIDELRSKHVIGDVLGRFFSNDGFIAKQALGETYITKDVPNMADQIYLGIPVDMLQKAKNIMCLCGGTHKIQAIISAAKQGLFHTLVTDSITAKELQDATIGRSV